MVNSNVTRGADGTGFPDIIRAAAANDVAALNRILEANPEALDYVDPHTGMTALHIACTENNSDFVRAAMAYTFDPWIRDRRGRTVSDHASAQRWSDIEATLLQKMYPNGWDREVPNEP